MNLTCIRIMTIAMCHAHSGQVILHETDSSAISKIIAEHSASASKYADFFRIAESAGIRLLPGDHISVMTTDSSNILEINVK